MRRTVLVACVLIALALAGFAAAALFTFGSTDSTISATKDNLGLNFKGVNIMTSPKAGTISSTGKVEGYMDGLGAGSGSEKVRAIIYSVDANNNPTTFLGVSNELTINAGTAAGWKTFTFPTSISIPAGKIGVGYWSGGATANLVRPSYDINGSTCVLKYNSNTYSSTGNPSNPFGTTTCGSQNKPWAIRVTADDGTPCTPVTTTVTTTTTATTTVTSNFTTTLTQTVTQTVTSTTTVTTTVTSPPPPPPTVYDKPIPHDGITPSFSILEESSAMQDLELDQIKRVGAEVVRIDYLVNNPWQPAADAAISKALGLGLEPDIVVGGTFNYPTSKTAATYGSECGTAATTYHNQARYYEVMNESNNTWPAATYETYLASCYDAIKAVDTRNIVLLGGVNTATSDPVGWVKGVYDAFGKSKFDLMNVHLYGDPANTMPWNGWTKVFGPGVSPTLVDIMAQNGDSAKPILSTEGGEFVGHAACRAPNYTSTCTEQDQAGIVSRNLADTRIQQSYIYRMLDGNDGFGLEVQDPAGTIIAPDGTHWRRRPAFESARVAMGGTG